MSRGRRHPRQERADGRNDSDRWLRCIALFKFVKAALLVVVGLGALELLRPGVAEQAQAILSALVLRSERASSQRLLAWLGGVSPSRLEGLAGGSFLYAALFTGEGVGLWLGRRWAEYVTVVTTLSFIPFEVHHLVRHTRLSGFSALALNLLVAGYLLDRLRQRPRRGGPKVDTAPHPAGGGPVATRDSPRTPSRRRRCGLIRHVDPARSAKRITWNWAGGAHGR